MGLKLFYLLLVFGLFYKCAFSAPIAKLNNDSDEDVATTTNEEEEDEETDDAESGDDGSGTKKDEIETEDDADVDDDDEGAKRDDITDNDDSDGNSDDSDEEKETANEENEDKSNNVEDDNEDSDEPAKKEEVPFANEEEEEDDQEGEDSDTDDSANEDNDAEKRSALGKRYYDHHDHEGKEQGHHHEHEHGHHEHEHEHHHHGHHHGFIHEWGQEEGGEHHGHEGQGHHEHHHDQDHDHHHHHGHHHEHQKHHHDEDGYGWARSETPLAYHCRDMVSKAGDDKAATKRFCVPIGYHSSYGIQYFHSNNPDNTGSIYNNIRSSIAHAHPENAGVRSSITHVDHKDTGAMIQADKNHESKVKKQTVHVGYGYASGDNYRLGYQQGGMGGLASSFAGGSVGADHGPENFDGPEQMKKSSLPFPNTHDVQATKRRFPGSQGGFSPFSHGSATPYGHPVTHPGFTTMGYPGHALASPDVRNKIDHPKVKRQIFNPEPFAAQQQPPQLSGAMNNMMESPSQMDPQGSPIFPNMLGQTPESGSAPMGLGQDEIGGTMRSMMPRYPGETPQYPPQLAGFNGFRGRNYVSIRSNEQE